MNLQDCVKFAPENPICYLATTDGDQPRVRGLQRWYADGSGFYFITLSPKRMSEQLHANPEVEICFYNNAAEMQDMKQMRVTGVIEFLADDDSLEKAYEAGAMLEGVVGTSVRPIVEPFRLATGEAHFWMIMDTLKERELERIHF